jgi:hypothetical protein
MTNEDARSVAVAERVPLHVVLPRLGEEGYCTRCHLATPSWRNRCIHCFQPLRRDDNGPSHNQIPLKPARRIVRR